MMDYKSMTTPMVENLRKMRDSESDLVDPSMYQKLIGSLMYLVNAMLDIFFAVNILNQFQLEPRHDHWVAKKHVLRYLCGTIDYDLRYVSNGDIQPQGYIDVDWAWSVEDRKSTYG